MVRSAVADEHLLTYLSTLSKQNSTVIGLILGQICSDKDYIVHFAKTAPLQIEEDEQQDRATKELDSIFDTNETVIADHARQVNRMLPGGIHVLGIFIVSPNDYLNPFNTKLKSILATVHKQLESNKYIFGNAVPQKLVLNYCTKTQKYLSKSYDVLSFNVQLVDFKFQPRSFKWINVVCNLDIDHLRYLKAIEADWHLQKHVKIILNKLYNSLESSVYCFDEEFRDDNESLENSEKKKIRRGRSQKTDDRSFQDSSKPIHISIYQSKHSSASDSYCVFKTCGQLRVVGQVACKLWLHQKITISEAVRAVKQDIMRSLSSRFEMHWDSLTEEENSEDVNCLHEPPRRVTIELPNNNITLSDYLFPGEGPQDAKNSLEELLDIKIKGKVRIQDIEGQTDISHYYDSALNRDSTEVLPKLNKNSNNFMYVILIFGVFVLLLSIVLHFYKRD